MTPATNTCIYIINRRQRTGQNRAALLQFASSFEVVPFDDTELVTNNTDEFARVPRLKLEDWTE